MTGVGPHVPGIQLKPALGPTVIAVWKTVSVEGPLFVIVIVCGADGTPSFPRVPKSTVEGLIVTVRKSAVALYESAPNNAGSPPSQRCSKRAENVSRLPVTFVVISSTMKRPEEARARVAVGGDGDQRLIGIAGRAGGVLVGPGGERLSEGRREADGRGVP